MAGTGSSLDRCVGDAPTFLAQIWAQRVHLHRGEDFQDLLSLDHVDQLVSGAALRFPAFRLVKAGATLPPAGYTRQARVGSRTITDLIDPGRVYRAFEEGATIVLQGLHRYWPPVTAFCRDLEQVLTHPVQANAYITPPVSQGLRVHSDPHDVFALQTHGHKQWVLYAEGPDAEPTLDAALAPGDCLYVPCGTAHAARTIDDASIHLTVGVRAFTWADALRPSVDAALDSEALGDSLPAGFADQPQSLAETLAERLRHLAAAIEKADPAVLCAAIAGRFTRGRSAAMGGQLRQLLDLDEVGEGTQVAARPGTGARLEHAGDSLIVELPDRTLRLPAAAEPAVRRLLNPDGCRVADLADLLDADSRALLAGRLVREGLLVVVGG